MARISLVDVVKNFGKLEAVKNLNLEIEDGEFMVLLGPSGCGKTTSLRMIAGLETVTSGEIHIDGVDVSGLPARKRDIAFVFQLYALYPHLSVHRNISFPLETQGVSRQSISQRVSEVSRMLEIEHLLQKKPHSLSGGDMQRVALARAVIRRPKAFLMDEPIGTLDAKFREQMRAELKRLHIDIGATTLYVTHDQVEAMSMGDRIAIMDHGKLQQVGEPGEVYENPANLFVANFIGSPGMNFADVRCVANGISAKAVLLDSETHFPLSQKLYKRVVNIGKQDSILVLGIRPEWVHISRKAKDGFREAEVFIVEPQGRYNIVDVKVGNAVIKAKTETALRLTVGERIWINLHEESIHLFDKDTGIAI